MKLNMQILSKRLSLLFAMATMSLIAFAQDSTGSVTATTTTTATTTEQTWYTQPWAWIVGGAIFILLIIALVRSGGDKSSSSSTDRTTVTKTVSRDTDV